MMSGIQKLSSMADIDDQEKDANAILMELDKGLLSSKPGEQFEAIVRFPNLFEKYPFPILINSAFLKLADVFREGSNFLRLWILEVTGQSEKHLDKILNVEEFVRRIFSVIHSNDPFARAITLLTLSSAACIISEKKNVHHSIISGLDSHDEVEFIAAIHAANRFANVSKSFAVSIYDKLAEMIEHLETPVDMKVRLIEIFQHMHHSTTEARKVGELCRQLLAKNQAQDYTIATLGTLSKLAVKTVVDIPGQIQLLLDYLQNDPRKSIQVLVLKDLKMLADKGSHMWTMDNIEILCNEILGTPYGAIKLGGLQVLAILAQQFSVTYIDMSNDSNAYKLVCELPYHSHLLISAKAIEVLTKLSIHHYKENSNLKTTLPEEAVIALETGILACTSEQSSTAIKALRILLLSAAKLYEIVASRRDHFMDALFRSLTIVPVNSAVMLCECLLAVGQYQSDYLNSLAPELLAYLKQLQINEPKQDQLKTRLCILLFQAFLDSGLANEMEDTLCDVLHQVNPWNVYSVARQASRYGHSKIASRLYASLTSKVASEHLYFWLSALRDLSLAEACLQEGVRTTAQFLKKAAEAETYYHQAISALKAASTPNFPLKFQFEFMRLRTRMLQAMIQVMKACASFKMAPPPAIATSLAMTTGLELHKCSHVVAQFHKCIRHFDDLSNCYGNLYQMSFDADPPSLLNLEILQKSCLTVVQLIDTVLNRQERTQPQGEPGVLVGTRFGPIEQQIWQSAFRQIKQLQHEALVTPSTAPIVYQHIECVQKTVILLAQVPFYMPRYFFQSLQTTGIKLAVSPQSRSPGEAVSISFSTHLAVKIEGIIEHGSNPGIFRKIDEVQIHIHSEQQSRAQMISETKVVENTNNEMTICAKPHNDYFSVESLLAFPVAGVHTVHIDTYVRDCNGTTWLTGPHSSLSVKSYDEAVQRQQQQQYAAQRQQQRMASAAAGSSTSH